MGGKILGEYDHFLGVLRTGEEGRTADGEPGGSVRIRRLHFLRSRSLVVRQEDSHKQLKCL